MMRQKHKHKHAGKKSRMLILLIWIFAVLAGCGVKDKALVLTGQEEENLQESISEITDPEEMQPDTAETEIAVHVCGAVGTPGVVKLPSGSRAEDALAAAGGFAEDADTYYVNLASHVTDGQQLYFPTIDEAENMRREKELASGGWININTAGLEQLCTLPGIGATRAQAIIDHREKHGSFQQPEDIMQVTGIKESAYAKICDRIVTQ